MRSVRMLRIGDILLMVSLAIVALILFALPLLSVGEARTLEILCAQTGEMQTHSLHRDGSYTVHSESLSLTISVHGGEVCVTESTCDNQICVHSRPISRTGQSIVCAPAGVVIRIVGEEVDADAISG